MNDELKKEKLFLLDSFGLAILFFPMILVGIPDSGMPNDTIVRILFCSVLAPVDIKLLLNILACYVILDIFMYYVPLSSSHSFFNIL